MGLPLLVPSVSLSMPATTPSSCTMEESTTRADAVKPNSTTECWPSDTVLRTARITGCEELLGFLLGRRGLHQDGQKQEQQLWCCHHGILPCCLDCLASFCDLLGMNTMVIIL